MSVVAQQKNYLADKKPFFKHFYPKDVAVLAVRTGAMQGLLVLNAYVASLDLEAEDSEDDDGFEDVDKKDPFVPPSPEEFSRACAKSFTKSISITTYTRSLEEVALFYFSPRIVGKLVKDISKSATRKYLRTSSRFMSAALMLKTGMRSSILGHLAIFLVEETQQLLVILYRKFTARKGGKKGGKHLRDGEADDAELETSTESFAALTLRNASRSGLAIITSGVGAAVGTLIRPGLGTIVGGTLGDTVAYVL